MGSLAEGTFHVMRHRNFRLLWFGFLISNAGNWIQAVAQAWLVYDLSQSAVWLGAIGFLRALPLITLALVGGTVADRFPKRRILFCTQAVLLLSSLLLGSLTYFGVVKVWHVLALAMLSATANAFDQPARQTLIPALVSKEELHAALSLTAIAFNGAAAFGPSLVGLLVPVIGLAGCFFVNAASFAAIFINLYRLEIPPQPPRKNQQSMFADVVAGLRYLVTQPIILALISMAGVISFFARPYQQFITVFAKDILQGDVGLAGMMLAAPAVGTILFMLTVASLGRIEWKGRLLVFAGCGFCLALVAFSWSTNAYLSLLLLVLVGGFNMTWQTTVNTLIQTSARPDMLGRVISVYTVAGIAMMPLGQGPMGFSMDFFGPQVALTLSAGIALAFVLYISFIRVKRVLSLE